MMRFVARPAGLFIAVGVYCVLCAAMSHAVDVERAPRISPDYADVVIPPNIAPLNFRIKEPGSAFRAQISAEQGQGFSVESDNGSIILPPDAWRALLEANRGGQYHVEVSVRNEAGVWRSFGRITNTIANEDMDRYLAYRLFKSLYRIWVEMNIYQRDLEAFDQRPIWRSRTFRQGDQGGCIHCHSFRDNRTDSMVLSYRDRDYGAGVILANKDGVVNLDTKFGYTSWHPSGKLIAFARMKVRQFFHNAGTQVREVVDLDSSLAYYVLDTQTVKSNPGINDPDRLESYPTWSPDGKYLYFSSAPILWTDPEEVPPKNWDKVRYDLRRISYDIDTDTFGEPETILSADRTGGSMLIPRISPDGRFLVFCMCDYGCFPINMPDSDLYIIDLRAAMIDGQYDYRKMEANSDTSESWHSWSSNSRWMVFSSKRIDGLFARPHFTYIDADGKSHKAFVLPQRDPTYYDTLAKTYTLPEFTIDRVTTTEKEILRALKVAEKLPITIDETGTAPKPWQPGVGRE